jgi:uncharacterized protein (DUF1778 family)
MQLPSLLVVVPQPHEPNRGVHATTHESASRVVIRTTKTARDLIQKWATLLDISEAEFMRGAAYNMARALEQQQRDKDNAHDSS